MAGFEPKGDESYRAMCIKMVRDTGLNGTIYYAEVEELLDCDRPAAQRAMASARRKMLRDGEEVFPATATKTGWVVRGVEGKFAHVDERFDRARQQVASAAEALHGMDEALLTPEQRQRKHRDLFRATAISGVMQRSRFEFDAPDEVPRIA